MTKTGIAISGGGIKSYAAIGVVKYAMEKGIRFSSYSGTSMGSVVASVLACGATKDELTSIMIELEDYFKKEKVFSPNFKEMIFTKNPINGFVDADKLELILSEVFKRYGVVNIKDIKVPLFVTAVDMISGRLVIFTNNKKQIQDHEDIIFIDDIDLSIAVRASCSFPLVFNSKKYKGMDLVDGGVRMNLPIWPLKRLKNTQILSVSMMTIGDSEESKSLIDVGKRVFDLFLEQSVIGTIPESDLNINVKVSTANPFDLEKGPIIIQEGYDTAQAFSNEFDQLVKNQSKLSILKNIF